MESDDDASITAAVKAKLAGEKLSTVTKVDVDTRNGIVTLTGSVNSETMRQRAVEIARQVEGVGNLGVMTSGGARGTYDDGRHAVLETAATGG